jgi:hypothetical protein
MMNDYSAEGAGNGNKLEKDDRIYKSKNLESQLIV